MNKFLKKINFKYITISILIVILLTYFSPLKAIGNNSLQAGFPLKFLVVYERNFNINLFSSFDFDLGIFILNIFIIYILIILSKNLINKKFN
ncbi:hypothetical protein SDC9_90350 [bioreactor metagenome]|jgi:hypothetical protein|uniref:Uncharacterized protein n=2 Tax=root TaxID=1 RepID=R9C9K1_9CLOT|nr:hypothetical protein A500_09610 [Clostridium sartagoforme AAU1]KLE15515.1 hypothetical protein AAT22_11115 [Clostridium sp. C8]